MYLDVWKEWHQLSRHPKLELQARLLYSSPKRNQWIILQIKLKIWSDFNVQIVSWFVIRFRWNTSFHFSGPEGLCRCLHAPIMRNMDVKWILIEDVSLVDRFYVPQSPTDNLGQFHKKHIIMEIQTSWDLFQSIYCRNWWFIGKMITFDESYDTEYCNCMILYAHTIFRK